MTLRLSHGELPSHWLRLPVSLRQRSQAECRRNNRAAPLAAGPPRARPRRGGGVRVGHWPGSPLDALPGSSRGRGTVAPGPTVPVTMTHDHRLRPEPATAARFASFRGRRRWPPRHGRAAAAGPPRRPPPAQRSMSASDCNNGYIADSNCPIMLGKGFGPPEYQVLFEKWAEIQTIGEHEVTKPEISGMQLLLSRMSNCDRSVVHEQILSGVIASTYQTILPSIVKEAEAGLLIENQFNLRDMTMQCADIAITNAADHTHVNIPTVHGILEVRWELSEKEFPEMQGTRLAEMFTSDKMASLRLPWIPIYVLSKNHFSFGVAFFFYDSWAYSEIHTYRMSDLISRQNVLMMFRFTRFMLVSAQHHHDKVKSLRMQPPRGLRGLQPLVDMNGIPLFTATPKFIAPRVLLTTDTSESGVYKVLKFYPDMASATSAVANRKLIEEALQLPLANYPIIEGCGGGICALQDEHITQCANVTISHVKNSPRLCPFCAANSWCMVIYAYPILFSMETHMYL